MTTVSRQQNGIGVLEVAGPVDGSTSGELEAAINELMPQVGYRLVLNLAGVAYISSIGLRVLLTALKRAKSMKGDVRICGTNETVTKIFRISGFLTLFDLAPSEAAALERFGT